MRVLLVEDDAMLSAATRTGLAADGFTIDCVADAKSALLALQTNPYDLVLLDLGLRDASGLDVLTTVRRKGNPIPVIVITAQDAIRARVDGLNAGADDYVSKPFDLNELAARMRAVSRRALGRQASIIELPQFEIDLVSRCVRQGGKTTEFTSSQFKLLVYLSERAGRIVPREQLEEALYSWDTSIESNAIQVYVSQIRKRLGAESIRTIRGMGYVVDK